MKSKTKKSITLVCMTVTIVFLGLFLYNNSKETKIVARDFTLEASQVTPAEMLEPCVKLDWTTSANSIDTGRNGLMSYAYKWVNNDWSPISTIDYSKIDVQVLNVSPWKRSDTQFNSVHDWMENTYDGIVYGNGQIHVTTITIEEFNANPSGYLKKTNNKWNYDVVVFGFADCNNNKDLSESAKNVMITYLYDNKGVIFGHDTIVNDSLAGDAGHYNFNALAGYAGVEVVNGTTWVGDTQVKVLTNSLFTRYPNPVTVDELTIPTSHTLGQRVLSTAKSFLAFKTGGSYTSSSEYFSSYLTVYKNAAMIQTGHSNGDSKPDERKIIANLIFYLNQLPETTSTIQTSDTDNAAPGKVMGGVIQKGDGVNANVNFTFLDTTDNGTSYKYKVEAYSKTDMNNQLGYAEKSITVTSGIEYAGFYVCKDGENFDASKATWIKLSDYPDIVSGGKITAQVFKYPTDLRMADLDGKKVYFALKDVAGNVGPTASTVCHFTETLTVDAVDGQFSDGTKVKTFNQLAYTKIDSLPIPTKTGYDFTGYVLMSGRGTVINGSGYTSCKFNYEDCDARIAATYDKKKYNIVYNYGVNGGTDMTQLSTGTKNTTAKIQTTQYYFGTTVEVSQINAQKDGWDFVGWSTSSDENNTSTISSVEVGTSTIQLYPVFKKKISATFVYYVGSTLTSTTNEFEVYNNGYAPSTNNSSYPSITDAIIDGTSYTPYGWTESHDIVSESNTSGYTPVGTSSTFQVTLSSQPTYYALYSKNISAEFVYYDTAGQKRTVDKSQTSAKVEFNAFNSDVKTSSTLYAPSLPTGCGLDGKSDWSFLGWTTANAGNASYELSVNSAYNVSNPVTYYALYKRTVTIAYDLNGGSCGSGIPNSTGTKYVNAFGTAISPAIKVTSSIPFISGKDFSGIWTDRDNPSLSYMKSSTYQFEYDTTLVAKWGASTSTKKTVNIQWNDWSNKNNSRPSQLQVKFTYADGKNSQYLILTPQNLASSSAINKWTGQIVNIPEGQENGTFSVVSCPSKNKYITYESKVNGDTITLAAHPIESTYSIPLSLVWYDTFYGQANYYGYRPNNIRVNVLQGSTGNEVLVNTYTVSKTATSQTLSSLTYYDDGGFPYVYNVNENQVDRYEQSTTDETSLDSSNAYITNHSLTLINTLFTKSAMHDGLTINTSIINSSNRNAEEPDFDKIGLQTHNNFNFMLTFTNISTPTAEKINVLTSDSLSIDLKGLPVGTYQIDVPDNMNFDYSKATLKTNSSYVTLTYTNGKYILDVKKGINFSDTATLTIVNALHTWNGYTDYSEAVNR